MDETQQVIKYCKLCGLDLIYLNVGTLYTGVAENRSVGLTVHLSAIADLEGVFVLFFPTPLASLAKLCRYLRVLKEVNKKNIVFRKVDVRHSKVMSHILKLMFKANLFYYLSCKTSLLRPMNLTRV